MWELTMDVRAAVAVAAGKPLEVTTVQLEGPKEGEVLSSEEHTSELQSLMRHSYSPPLSPHHPLPIGARHQAAPWSPGSRGRCSVGRGDRRGVGGGGRRGGRRPRLRPNCAYA